MPSPRRSKNPEILSEMENLFVANFSGDPAKAATVANYKHPHVMGKRLMTRPRVQRALALKQDAMLKESGKRLGRVVDISRNEVIMLFADIARTGESESARVSALGHLKEILGLSPKNDKDTDIFAGWSREELDQYALTGELPERIRSGVLPSEGAIKSS